ncbi:protocatechuate 3,4-dioxygenase subunit alpha [Pseudonocardia nantongensis]|uniref:dioxygenase family protein n=1 Tax=Pseudonocardia nantongensis TaxID=1181885 RepID=UPI003979269D
MSPNPAPAPTPSQTVGPFLSLGLTWTDGADVVPEGTPGAVTITGVVRDGNGDPVTDAMIETWQADPDGRFDHPDDPRGAVVSAVPGFRGFGRSATDAEGRWWIRTVRPGALPAPDGGTEAPHGVDVCSAEAPHGAGVCSAEAPHGAGVCSAEAPHGAGVCSAEAPHGAGVCSAEAPHIDVSVFARGLLDRVVTRIYFPDEAAANAADPVLAAVPADRRDTLVATDAGEGTLRFDIRLRGAGETVFLAV